MAQQHYYQFHHQQRGPNAQNHQANVISAAAAAAVAAAAAAAAATPSFTYSFPENMNNNNNNIHGQSANNKYKNDEIPFAVNPSDPRYYDESTSSTDSKSFSNDNYNNKNQLMNTDSDKDFNTKINNNNINNNNGNVVPYSRLKPPMEINPKMPLTVNNNNNKDGVRHDINALVDKLEREGQVNAIINDRNMHERNDVTKKHMGIEGEMGMYVVALIAGVSAAITVGIIALGIGWYT